MRKTAMLFGVALLTGCAATPKERALQTAIVADVAMDEFTNGWEIYAEAKIAECRKKDLPTPEEREACVGLAAKSGEVVALAETVVTAQRAIYVAAQCDASELLQAKPAECPEGEIGWGDLTKNMVDAIARIRPYFDALKEK